MTGGGGRESGVSERLYRWLLGAYTKEFREEYGPQMLQAFGDLCRAELQFSGRRGLIGLWVRTLVDLLINALAERSRRGGIGIVDLLRGVRWLAPATGVGVGVVSYFLLYPIIFGYFLILSLFGGGVHSSVEQFAVAYVVWIMPTLHLLLVAFATLWVVSKVHTAPVTHGILIALISVVVMQLIVLFSSPPMNLGEAVMYLIMGMGGGALGGFSYRIARREAAREDG